MLKYSNMPQGTIQINFIQIFSTIGFAVLLDTLNLYLQSKGMPMKMVNTLTASQTNPMYIKMFLLMAAIAVIVTVGYIVIAPFTRKLKLTPGVSS